MLKKQFRLLNPLQNKLTAQKLKLAIAVHPTSLATSLLNKLCPLKEKPKTPKKPKSENEELKDLFDRINHIIIKNGKFRQYNPNSSNSENGPKKGKGKSDKNGPKMPLDSKLLLESLLVLLLFIVFTNMTNEIIMNRTKISFSEFARKYVAKGLVKQLTVYKNVSKAVLSDSSYGGGWSAESRVKSGEDWGGENGAAEEDDFETKDSETAESWESLGPKVVNVDVSGYNNVMEKMESLQAELGVPRDKHVDVVLGTELPNFNFLKWVLPVIIIVSLFKTNKFMMSKVKSFGFLKFDVKPVKPKTRFRDVAGLKEAKAEMIEFTEFLKNPKKFSKLGARIPKGALMVGAPGTGKTLIAKAIAGEANCSFYTCAGSDFVEMVGGLGSKRVKKLFTEARKNAPSIIFIDEFDAVAKKRSTNGIGNHAENEQTLNQLLVEMDGFQKDSNVVVFAATNHAESLDPAVKRAGRFDRQIHLDKPNLSERKEIFELHLKAIKTTAKATKAVKLAALTPGYTGADIANICSEAAIFAARAKKSSVDTDDFIKALDRVIGGLERRNLAVSPEERRVIAIHESGHAVASWFSEHSNPLLKVTIVPRSGGVMGFAQYLPKEMPLMCLEEIRAMIATALGGRLAESVFYGHLSTGAANDLERVTQLAYGSVREFGFSSEMGVASYGADNPNSFFQKPLFSEKTGMKIDQAVQRIVKEIADSTKEIIIANKDKLKALADRLIEKETIEHDEIERILGPKPAPNEQYKLYLKSKREPTKEK